MNILKSIIGKRVEFEILDKHSSNQCSYISQLLDTDGSVVELSTPVNELGLNYIPANSYMNVIFKNSRNSLLFFIGKVVSNNKKSPKSILVNIESDIKPFQRREYFRLDYIIDLKYSVHTDDSSLYLINKNSSIIRTAETKNISGNGLLTVLSKKYVRGTLLDLELIFINTNIKIVGEIVRCSKIKNHYHEYETGIKFIEINKKDYDFLLRFIFETQRNLGAAKK